MSSNHCNYMPLYYYYRSLHINKSGKSGGGYRGVVAQEQRWIINIGALYIFLFYACVHRGQKTNFNYELNRKCEGQIQRGYFDDLLGGFRGFW